MRYPVLTSLVAVAVVAIVVLVIAASRQPVNFRVERSIAIHAPAADVFSQVNDFHPWRAWSPWADMDPQATYSYDGPASGEGAGTTWAGNRKMGQGRMTIVQSRPNELVRLRLEFVKPMAATNMAEFTFVPQGRETLVTWVMTGKNNFMFRALHTVINMDKLVGGDFERGLAKLKTLTEANAR